MAASRGSAVRRVGQVLTGFGALVVLCGVLVGAPVALLTLAGNPLPDHVPTLAEIGTTLTSRDDGQLFLRALAVLGWFGWATFAFSVLVELVAQVLRRPAPKLPGMRRQQRAAAALVGSVALILAAAPAAASAATVASAPYPAVVAAGPAVAHPAVVASGPAAASAQSTLVAGGPAVAAGGPAGRAVAGPAATGVPPRAGVPEKPAANPVYRVARGDYLGEVAERYLDDFERYHEVAALNRLPDADRIQPGQLIRLPARADDGGERRHATGHLVSAGSTPRKPAPATESSPPRKPSPHPPAAGSTGPHTSPTPDERTVPGETTPGESAPGAPTDAGGATSVGGPTKAGGPADDRGATSVGGSGGQPAPADQVGQPAGAPPAMAAGASRAGQDDGMNRPLAVSAVLAVASIVGAQIGAVLGLRRRPGRALINGRHRRE
ncbi:LysM peptidoglycan-binding domain-containing protein [Micromonospora sp. PLK6-60]|uniref:LysM peptidoglycan-binding domain-containing protein n=1 Tax=Micromonospora sp. PLK6-60 TaxID=2873383 RepID=UPI001CA794A6|nr:LysM domain-containing protein [Micromonospora sp. PLK6-60]MBY8872054.1 LysM peptidoglycan-binding domain-containing protein [Micromonospora sp. PLK6-60]